MEKAIKCKCGQRIFAKNIILTEFVTKSESQAYIYLRFRCPHCKRIDNRIIPHKYWNKTILFESKKKTYY